MKVRTNFLSIPFLPLHRPPLFWAQFTLWCLLTSASFLLCLVLISSACFSFGVFYFLQNILLLKPHVLTCFFLKLGGHILDGTTQ